MTGTMVRIRSLLLLLAPRVLVSRAWPHAETYLSFAVHRVRQLSLSLTRCPSLSSPPDLLVVELSALFHDVADAKYASSSTSAAHELRSFFDAWTHVISPEQRKAIERICANVSWSADEKRRRAKAQLEASGGTLDEAQREEEQWRQTCPELACVSDADRLDAIGSIGTSPSPLPLGPALMLMPLRQASCASRPSQQRANGRFTFRPPTQLATACRLQSRQRDTTAVQWPTSTRSETAARRC